MKDFVEIIESLNLKVKQTVNGYEKTSKEMLHKYHQSELDFNKSYKTFTDARYRKEPEDFLSMLEKNTRQKEHKLRTFGSELRVIENYLREDLLAIAGEMSGIHDDFIKTSLSSTARLEKEVIQARNNYLTTISKCSSEYKRIKKAESEQIELFQKLKLKKVPILPSSFKPIFTGSLKVEQDTIIHASEIIFNKQQVSTKKKRGMKSWLNLQLKKLRTYLKRLMK